MTILKPIKEQNNCQLLYYSLQMMKNDVVKTEKQYCFYAWNCNGQTEIIKQTSFKSFIINMKSKTEKKPTNITQSNSMVWQCPVYYSKYNLLSKIVQT